MQIKKEAKVNSNIIKILSIIIMLAGFVVILGWIFDISLIKSVIPNAPNIRLATAIAFVFTGGIIYYLNEHQKGNAFTASVIIPFFVSIVFLLVSFFLVLDFSGVYPGVDNLFASSENILSAPNILALLNLLLICLVAMLRIFNKPSYKMGFKIIGIVIVLTGLTAVLGFILNQPIMYYQSKGLDGMAIHTAILFIITGISFILLRRY